MSGTPGARMDAPPGAPGSAPGDPPLLPISRFFDWTAPPRPRTDPDELARRVAVSLLDPQQRREYERLCNPLRPEPRRTWRRGLSGAPYLAAPVQDARFVAEIRPGGVRIRLSREGQPVPVVAGGSGRGQVREFSLRSRLRLGDLARDLGEVYRPDIMLTLTYPGDWRTVCTSGRKIKRHLGAIRKRIDRYLATIGLHEWSALWFLEFQRRGAPHFHLIAWGPRLREMDLRQFRRWLARAWAEVVDHPDVEQRRRHLRAGTGADWMRRPHFGYAVKYASKVEQKRVPEGFGDVGRFWGLWNGDPPPPRVVSARISLDDVRSLGEQLATVARQHSPRFASRLLGKIEHHARTGDPVSLTVYGPEAARSLAVALAHLHKTQDRGSMYPPGPN